MTLVGQSVNSYQSSVISHPSSVVSHQLSVIISHQSSVIIIHQSSVISHQCKSVTAAGVTFYYLEQFVSSYEVIILFLHASTFLEGNTGGNGFAGLLFPISFQSCSNSQTISIMWRNMPPLQISAVATCADK